MSVSRVRHRRFASGDAMRAFVRRSQDAMFGTRRAAVCCCGSRRGLPARHSRGARSSRSASNALRGTRQAIGGRSAGSRGERLGARGVGARRRAADCTSSIAVMGGAAAASADECRAMHAQLSWHGQSQSASSAHSVMPPFPAASMVATGDVIGAADSRPGRTTVSAQASIRPHSNITARMRTATGRGPVGGRCRMTEAERVTFGDGG